MAVPPPPQAPIEEILNYMVRKSEVMHSREKGLELLMVSLTEAEAKYNEAEAKYNEAKARYYNVKESNNREEQEFKDISTQYSASIRDYASNKNPSGIECTTQNDLFTYFVLKKYGNYEGQLYIPSSNLMLIAKAHDLGLHVSDKPVQHTDLPRPN